MEAIYTGRAKRSHIQLDAKILGRHNGCTVLMLFIDILCQDKDSYQHIRDIAFQQWICQTIRDQNYDTSIRDDELVSVFSYVKNVFSTWVQCGKETFPHNLLSALMSSSRFHPWELVSTPFPPEAYPSGAIDAFVVDAAINMADTATSMSISLLHLSELNYIHFDFFSALIGEIKQQYANHPNRAIWIGTKSVEEFLADLFNPILRTLYNAFEPQLLIDCLLLLPAKSLMSLDVAELIDDATTHCNVRYQFHHLAVYHRRYSYTPIRINTYILHAIQKWKTQPHEGGSEGNGDENGTEEIKQEDPKMEPPSLDLYYFIAMSKVMKQNRDREKNWPQQGERKEQELTTKPDNNLPSLVIDRVSIDSEVAPYDPLLSLDSHENSGENLPPLQMKDALVKFFQNLRSELPHLLLRTRCVRAFDQARNEKICDLGMKLLMELLTAMKEQPPSKRVSFMWEVATQAIYAPSELPAPTFFTLHQAICRLSTARLQTLLPHIEQLLDACDRTENQSNHLVYDDSDLLQICDAWEMDDFILGPVQSVRWMLLDRIMSQYYYDLDSSNISINYLFDDISELNMIDKSMSVPSEARRGLFKRICQNLIQQSVVKSSLFRHDNDNDDLNQNQNQNEEMNETKVNENKHHDEVKRDKQDNEKDDVVDNDTTTTTTTNVSSTSAAAASSQMKTLNHVKKLLQTLFTVCQLYPTQLCLSECQIIADLMIYECIRCDHTLIMQWLIDEGRLTTSDWLIRDHESSNENIVERVRADFATYDTNTNASYQMLENAVTQYMAEVLPQRHALVCEVMIPPLADIVTEYLVPLSPLPTSNALTTKSEADKLQSSIVDSRTIESNRLNSFHHVDWKKQEYEFWLAHLFPAEHELDEEVVNEEEKVDDTDG